MNKERLRKALIGYFRTWGGLHENRVEQVVDDLLIVIETALKSE